MGLDMRNTNLFLLLFLAILMHGTSLPQQAHAGELYGQIHINNALDYGYRRSLHVGQIGYSNTRRSTAAQRQTNSRLFTKVSRTLSASEQLVSKEQDYQDQLELWRWKKEIIESAAAEGRIISKGRVRGEPAGYGQQRRAARLAKIYAPVPARSSSLHSLRSVGAVSTTPRPPKEAERKNPTVWDRFRKLF